MGANETSIFRQIIEKTDSVILIFFILIILAFVVVFIPFYKVIMNDRIKRKEAEQIRFDKMNQREAQLIEVITKNTEVLSELKTLFIESEKHFTSFSSQLLADIASLDKKTDTMLTSITLIENNIGMKKNEAKSTKQKLEKKAEL